MESEHGCCADGVTAAVGKDGEGCPTTGKQLQLLYMYATRMNCLQTKIDDLFSYTNFLLEVCMYIYFANDQKKNVTSAMLGIKAKTKKL